MALRFKGSYLPPPALWEASEEEEEEYALGVELRARVGLFSSCPPFGPLALRLCENNRYGHLSEWRQNTPFELYGRASAYAATIVGHSKPALLFSANVSTFLHHLFLDVLGISSHLYGPLVHPRFVARLGEDGWTVHHLTGA